MFSLAKRIGLSEVATGDTTSRAGLIGSPQGKEFKPGLLPRSDGKMLTIDEMHKLDPETIRNIAGVRTEGVMRIRGRVDVDLPCRVRLMAIGNLQRGASRRGMRSVSLDGLGAGIEGAAFLELEDLRRFDGVLVVSRAAASAAPDAAPQPLDLRPLVRLLRGYWGQGRRREELQWGDGAFEAVAAAAVAINGRFACDTVPLFGPETFDKVCRFAVALARILPVSDDRRTRITAAHVLIAEQLLTEVHAAPACGLEEIARRERQARAAPSDEELDGIWRALADGIPIESLEAIIEALDERPQQTTANLTGRIKRGVRTTGKYVRVLREAGLVRSRGSGGLEALPLLRALAARRRRALAAGQDESGTSDGA